jgi:hypothetical protein
MQNKSHQMSITTIIIIECKVLEVEVGVTSLAAVTTEGYHRALVARATIAVHRQRNKPPAS